MFHERAEKVEHALAAVPQAFRAWSRVQSSTTSSRSTESWCQASPENLQILTREQNRAKNNGYEMAA